MTLQKISFLRFMLSRERVIEEGYWCSLFLFLNLFSFFFTFRERVILERGSVLVKRETLEEIFSLSPNLSLFFFKMCVLFLLDPPFLASCVFSFMILIF